MRDPRQEFERVGLPPSPLRWEPYVGAAWGDLPLCGSGGAAPNAAVGLQTSACEAFTWQASPPARVLLK